MSQGRNCKKLLIIGAVCMNKITFSFDLIRINFDPKMENYFQLHMIGFTGRNRLTVGQNVTVIFHFDRNKITKVTVIKMAFRN